MKKLICILLTLSMILCQASIVLAVDTGFEEQADKAKLDKTVLAEAGEASSANDEKKIKGDCWKQYAATLFEANQIICNRKEAGIAAPVLSIDKNSQTLLIKGTNEELLNAEFVIDKEYNFEKTLINRFSLNASAAKGQRVKLGFYLDNESEPFVTAALVRQKKKNVWTYSKNTSVDIDNLKLTGRHTIKFKIVEISGSSADISIDSFEFVKSGVPVIYFDIDESQGTIAEMNSSYDHSDECYGKMNIEIPDGYVSEYTGKKFKTTSGYDNSYELEYIRGRGNSTWGTGKNPYKIKLEEKQDLLGMGKNKHWVLLANYYDNSLLRNKITYWLGDTLGMPYTPKSEPVDVVMNGEYYGSYFLCEHIRVDKTRVNIDDLEKTPTAVNEPEVSGGYLLSLAGYNEEDDKKGFTTNGGVDFLIESPTFEGDVVNEQVKYIEDYCNRAESAFKAKDGKNDAGEAFSDLVDMKSMAMYYLVQEFSLNGDGYASGSTYLYKPRNDKLYWGPLWDFDYVAWGSTEYEEPMTEGFTHQYSAWNEYMLRDSESIKILSECWSDYKKAVDELIKEGGQLDKYADRIRTSAEYNFEELGPSELAYTDEEKPNDLSFDEEVDRLRTWISMRATWFDEHFGELTPQEVEINYYTEDGKLLYTAKELDGRELTDIPQAPTIENKTFMYWEYTVKYSFEEYLKYLGYENEEALRSSLREDGASEEYIDEYVNDLKVNGAVETGFISDYGYAYKGMSLTARYIDIDDIVPIEKIYTLKDNYSFIYYDESGWYDQEISIPYSCTPEEATFFDVDISSDNDSVIKVGEDNFLMLQGPGDAKITFKAGSVTKTVNVHVYNQKELEEECTFMERIELPSNLKMKDGTVKQLKMSFVEEAGIMYEDPRFFSSDESVAMVDDYGVVRAVGQGSATIICIFNDAISCCKVTVTKNKAKVGAVNYIGGLKYRVDRNYKNDKRVICLGAYKKTKNVKKSKYVKNTRLTKISIPSTVEIEGVKFKVDTIAPGAFKNFKKLKSVSVGYNVKVIGEKAFYGDKKLATIKLYPKKILNIEARAFNKISRKASFYVKKDLVSQYKAILNGRTIKAMK